MGDMIRYRYVEGSATANGANFTRHALGGMPWGDGWRKKPWDDGAISMDLREIQMFYNCADRPGADKAEIANKVDFGRALVDIKKAQNLKATSSPHNPTHG